MIPKKKSTISTSVFDQHDQSALLKEIARHTVILDFLATLALIGGVIFLTIMYKEYGFPTKISVPTHPYTWTAMFLIGLKFGLTYFKAKLLEIIEYSTK